MKTKEEIIDKIFMDAIGEENTMKLSLIILELIHDCMSEYATDQTAKWRELCEARKELQLIIDEILVQNAGRAMAGTGIYTIPNDIVTKAKELRQKISELEKQIL
jgi:hypothetical protein